MKGLKSYKIDIFGLKNGSHEFEFSFDDAFFAEFEYSMVSKGKGACKILMDKTETLLTLTFHIEGFIQLACDRSLELFDYPIKKIKSIVYKYGDEEKELSEDVFVILKTTQQIHIGSFLYELISLEVPMKKLHPKYELEEANEELIFSSQETDEKQQVDPRWDALKKLKKT